MNLESKISVEITRQVFEGLQSLAEPLIDDPNSVIEKLLNHWKTYPPGIQENKTIYGELWVSARGEQLPVGLRLHAKYNGKNYEAEVIQSGISFQNEIFNSPSAAAIHVKNLAGLTGNSANTNGWKFWEFYDKKTEVWRSIESFRISL
jgi:hypothetical protein